MTDIFISYRRQDSAAAATRLRQHLSERYGSGRVFVDIEDLAPGASFAAELQSAVESCKLMLVVIGPHWAAASDAKGRRRLDSPDDFIRTEIAAALRSDKRVVPVLVGGASMPSSEELPADVEALARRRAVTLNDTTWTSDLAPLFLFIDSQLAGMGADRSATSVDLRPPRIPRPPLASRLVGAFNVLMGRSNKDLPTPVEYPTPPVVRSEATLRPLAEDAPVEEAASRPISEKISQVFVSYADEDRETADQVVSALESRNFSCWVAHRDIPPGSRSWSAPIVSAIANSRVVVVLVTRHSITSKQVLREVTV